MAQNEDKPSIPLKAQAATRLTVTHAALHRSRSDNRAPGNAKLCRNASLQLKSAAMPLKYRLYGLFHGLILPADLPHEKSGMGIRAFVKSELRLPWLQYTHQSIDESLATGSNIRWLEVPPTNKEQRSSVCSIRSSLHLLQWSV